MAKLTQKYKAALKLPTLPSKSYGDDYKAFYQDLNELGWYWDASRQKWEYIDRPADIPTNLVRIRVWTNAAKIEKAASTARENMEKAGYTCLEQSMPYPCRPPKQMESRVYLTFE